MCVFEGRKYSGIGEPRDLTKPYDPAAEREEELRELQEPVSCGCRWRVDREAGTLDFIEKPGTPGGWTATDPYWISLDRVDVGFLKHVEQKSWCTDELLGRLFRIAQLVQPRRFPWKGQVSNG